MKRSHQLLVCTAIASAVLVACGGSDDTEEPVASLDEVRTSMPLMTNWKFVQDDLMTDAQAQAASGTNWSSVNLPHTWNETDGSTTAQSTPTTPDYKRGKGWYRLEFDHTPGRSATQWLQFDAASNVADVWLNGVKLGQHRGAFTRFRFDVTGVMKSGRNVLLVKTDTTPARADADTTNIAPLAGDFNVAGGLYRPVSLIGTPHAVHIALDDFGASGVYARTTTLNGTTAVVNVVAKVRNDGAVDGTYSVVATLVDADGKTIKKTSSVSSSVAKGTTASVSQDMTVEQARLWNGLADPYLYSLVLEVKDASGSTIDKVVQRFGIRTMSFDAARGFFLNGKSVPLHGVNIHQDVLNKSWAITSQDIEEKFAFIKEVGANTLRLAHYPHADYTVEQADKLGLVVWAELPLVNSTNVTRNVDPETTGFAANARQQLTELIRQKFNNASVGIWSIANEVTGGTDASNNVQPLLTSLNRLAKQEDPLRMTTLANQVTRSGDIIRPDSLTQIGYTDSYSINRYFQWYYGTSETQLGENLDDLHTNYPAIPIGVSEYGAGNAITHHTDNVRGGRVCERDGSNSTRICYQPEGYANYVHEKDYAQMVARPYISGTWIWAMFDFASGNRHEGDIGQTNTKGIVTYGKDVKKDIFYFYKANWTTSPVTYITSRRYVQRAYGTTNIKVYSNADAVTLKLNDIAVGTKTAAECPMKVCEFDGVTLSPGANVVSATGVHGSTSVSDSANWNLGADNATNVYIAAGQLTTGFRSTDTLLGNHMFGSDNFFVGGEIPTPGLRNNTVIAGIGSTTVPETGRVWDQWREGASFSYRIPVANGNYLVNLGFLEPTATAAGVRVFNVDANGTNKLSGIDVFRLAGARNSAIARSFTVTVTNGRLDLDFKGTTGKAIASNISIVKQ